MFTAEACEITATKNNETKQLFVCVKLLKFKDDKKPKFLWLGNTPTDFSTGSMSVKYNIPCPEI